MTSATQPRFTNWWQVRWRLSARWLRGRWKRFKKMEYWRWATQACSLVLLGVSLGVIGVGMLQAPPAIGCAAAPMLDPGCARQQWLAAGVVLLVAGIVAWELTWTRSTHVFPELVGVVGLLLLTAAVLNPLASPADSSGCAGIGLFAHGPDHHPDICLTPDVLSTLLLVIMFVVAVGVVLVRRTRDRLPDLVVTAFILLIVGGVWLRDVRSVPSLDTGQTLQLRVPVSDLANGAALVRPGEVIDIVLTGQGDAQQQVFEKVTVLGLYAADGHSVAYTGELPNNVLLAVPQNKFDAVLAAVTSKKQPAYLQAHSAVTPAPSMSSMPPPAVLIPLRTELVRPFDVSVLFEDNRVVLVVIDERVVQQGTPLARTTQMYDVRVVGCNAQYLYVRLERGRRDLTVRNLTDQLPDAREIYLLPALPSTPGPEVTPQPAPAISTQVPAADQLLKPPEKCAQHLLPPS